MALIDNKLALEDLYIGMEIKDKDQLSSIYDTWIMLVKNNNSDVYKVGFIGKETNAESDKLFTQGNVVCPVYNDSMELEGDIGKPANKSVRTAQGYSDATAIIWADWKRVLLFIFPASAFLAQYNAVDDASAAQHGAPL